MGVQMRTEQARLIADMAGFLGLAFRGAIMLPGPEQVDGAGREEGQPVFTRRFCGLALAAAIPTAS